MGEEGTNNRRNRRTNQQKKKKQKRYPQTSLLNFFFLSYFSFTMADNVYLHNYSIWIILHTDASILIRTNVWKPLCVSFFFFLLLFFAIFCYQWCLWSCHGHLFEFNPRCRFRNRESNENSMWISFVFTFSLSLFLARFCSSFAHILLLLHLLFLLLVARLLFYFHFICSKYMLSLNFNKLDFPFWSDAM